MKLIIVLISLFILSACSGPTLPKMSEQGVILAFGDSLTAGVGAAKGQDYPAQLAALSGKTVINAGVSGETTTKGLNRFSQVVEQYSPEVILLLEGGNDFLRQHSLAKTKQNLAAMIEIANRKAIPVILIAVPEKSLFLSAPPIYAELAKQYDVLLVEDKLSDLLGQSAKKSDLIHLNNRGYAELAQHIHQVLKDAKAY